nr:MAG TPA: hypothetical protein [Caudoviricetes sp.]
MIKTYTSPAPCGRGNNKKLNNIFTRGAGGRAAPVRACRRWCI